MAVFACGEIDSEEKSSESQSGCPLRLILMNKNERNLFPVTEDIIFVNYTLDMIDSVILMH